MLTDTALKHLRPREKIYKVTDRDGMYVLVKPSGTLRSCSLRERSLPAATAVTTSSPVAAGTCVSGAASREMRRTGTLHGVLAFVFNTMILAVVINLAASLF